MKNASRKSVKEVVGIVAVLLVYGALVLAALAGFIVYLVREDPGMALVYLALLSLLIGLAVYLGHKANEDDRRKAADQPPIPPAVIGLRKPGSGNQGRRWP